MSPTLAAHGLRQPAEWADHDAVWLGYPWMAEEWADGLAPPRRSFAALCAAIADLDPATGAARGERLEILVRPSDEAGLRAALGPVPARFHHIPYGDVWLRDTGPVFLTRLTRGLSGMPDSGGAAVVAARFRFNGWGGKYLFEADPAVAAQVADSAGVPRIEHDWVLEGGGIEVDGDGTVLTTRQCLLNPNRNPGLSQEEIEARLCEALGVERVLWLDRGLRNDHTDGHIDTLARFVAPGVVACMEPADGDPNADALRGIIADLGAMRDARGRRLEIATVPSPGAVFDGAEALMPASYMNFYIGNRAVVVPTYGAAADDAAVAAIAALFPERATVGVAGKAILVGGGAFHCITQQQPSAPA